ncbi:MAG: NAD(P)H-hydrate dehydratase [Parachlamydiaceae bacterium]|nr:NAD(P)H-hydrate dehydratase [Parachlamydiaceae bacterium]
MKVVTAKVMSELESMAYKDGFSENAFMENAGQGIAIAVHEFIDTHSLDKRVLLLCGKGNNGGDAFVAGCHLIDQGYSVNAIQLDRIDDCSNLCKSNGQCFINKGGQIFKDFKDIFSGYSVLLDGIFGTGFKGDVKEPYSSLIKAANQSHLPILSIDIPSGLNGTTGETGDAVIQATQTIYLGLPKTGFFLLNGWNFVGKLKYVDFGLPQHIIDKANADFILSTEKEMAKLLPPITRNRHKYLAGLVIGLAGSPGMPGASLLSALAALRGGCGMVRLLHPEGMQSELSPSPYELIKVSYTFDDLQKVIDLMQKGNATFVGPGLGTTDDVRHLLQNVMPSLEYPCVIDADALTLFADKAFKMPKEAILTPHTGEMQKLLHQKKHLVLSMETIKLCQKFSEENKITLVLKGAPTFIFQSDFTPYINPTGDPGMATAGSGDVLTGLLASLIAQGLSCHDAAILGVYLHGLSGEYAACERTSYCMIASDLIKHFQDAYMSLMR